MSNNQSNEMNNDPSTLGNLCGYFVVVKHRERVRRITEWQRKSAPFSAVELIERINERCDENDEHNEKDYDRFARWWRAQTAEQREAIVRQIADEAGDEHDDEDYDFDVEEDDESVGSEEECFGDLREDIVERFNDAIDGWFKKLAPTLLTPEEQEIAEAERLEEESRTLKEQLQRDLQRAMDKMKAECAKLEAEFNKRITEVNGKAQALRQREMERNLAKRDFVKERDERDEIFQERILRVMSQADLKPKEKHAMLESLMREWESYREEEKAVGLV